MIIGAILIIAIVFYTKSTSKAKAENPNTKTAQTESQINQNQYEELRKLALSTKAEQLNLTKISNEKIYGIVTDIGMGNGFATIVAFLTGDTSIYLSSGGGYIGAGNHKNVNEKVKQIVTEIQKYKDQAQKIEVAELPNQNEVKFNFLTKKGLYQITADYEDLISQKSEHTELYKEIDNLITLIREKSGE